MVLYTIFCSVKTRSICAQYRWFGGGEVEGIPLVFEENSSRPLNQTKPHINICMKKIECIKPKHWDSKKCQKQPKSTVSTPSASRPSFKHQETPRNPMISGFYSSRYWNLNWRSWAKWCVTKFTATWGGMFWAARSCGFVGWWFEGLKSTGLFIATKLANSKPGETHKWLNKSKPRKFPVVKLGFPNRWMDNHGKCD